MGSPLDGLDGERSPKRRRVSGAKGLRGGDASYVYDQEELPFANLRPQANDARNTPQISITRGSDSDASTPRPPLPSPLDGASDTSDNNHNRYTLLPSADTPRSQRSSQMDSEDEYPPSRSSPIPPETPRDMATPQVHYRPKLILRGHKRGVSCVKFSPDGKWIASCSADATLKTWHALTGAHAHTFHGHLAGISTLAWSPDSNLLATGSDDKTIRLWDACTGAPPLISKPLDPSNPLDPSGSKIHRPPLLGHHNYVYALAFSPKGNMLVSGSHDEAVHLWDVRLGTLLRTLPAHSDPIGGVDFSHDGTLIASCASDGLIRVWDTATGQCLRTFFHEDTPAVVSVRFCPNGRFVAAWMLDGCLRLWDYGQGRCVKTFMGHVNGRFSLVGGFGRYGGANDGGGGSGRVEVETDGDGGGGDGVDGEEGDSQKGLEKRQVTGRKERAFITSGSEDGNILVWDVVSKMVLQKLHGHEGPVLAVDTHPTDKAIVSCGVDKTIRIWRSE